MAKQYEWRAYTKFDVLPDPTYFLTHGVTPADQSDWQRDTAGVEHTGTWQYWYHDANRTVGGLYTDENASRVVVSLTQTWTTEIDRRNNLTVNIHTIINSVVRDNALGSNTDTPGRYINLYREEGGQPVLSLTDTQVATNHTIYQGPLDLGTSTFTIAPGQDIQRSSMYLHNQTIGAVSYDDIWCGVQFKNILPRETIPHAVLGSDGKWYSHNRAGGDLRLWLGNRWSDNLPNVDGGTGLGDPPSVYHDGKYYNGRTFGLE